MVWHVSELTNDFFHSLIQRYVTVMSCNSCIVCIFFYRCQTNNRLIKIHLNRCAGLILHPALFWQSVNGSWCSSGRLRPGVFCSCSGWWLVTPAPRPSIRMGDYNRVSRRERPAYPVASFLLHIDNNIMTQLYDQQRIDLGGQSSLGHIY